MDEHEEVEGMANARLLQKKISRSEQVNNLSDRAALLYTWGIAHTDDFGRMDGRPRIVRATIVPLKEWTDAEVESYLYEMAEHGLIQYYMASGIKIVQYTGFEQNQSGLHKRTRSNYPAPTETFCEVPGISGKPSGSSSGFPPELESETELEEIHVRSDKRTSEYPSDFDEFWTFYPRKVNKKGALDKWKATLRKDKDVTGARLVNAAKNYAVFCKSEGTVPKFILHAATFLGHQERWKEFEEPVSVVENEFRYAGPSKAFSEF